MDMSFANQALAAEDLVRAARDARRRASTRCPSEIDREVARLKLALARRRDRRAQRGPARVPALLGRRRIGRSSRRRRARASRACAASARSARRPSGSRGSSASSSSSPCVARLPGAVGEVAPQRARGRARTPRSRAGRRPRSRRGPRGPGRPRDAARRRAGTPSVQSRRDRHGTISASPPSARTVLRQLVAGRDQAREGGDVVAHEPRRRAHGRGPS